MTEVLPSSDARAEDALERVGVALADPIRRSILMMLADGPSYPTLMASAFRTSPSNLSNHLACLRDCGLVVSNREGRRVRYELSTPDVAFLLRELERVAAGASSCREQPT